MCTVVCIIKLAANSKCQSNQLGRRPRKMIGRLWQASMLHVRGGRVGRRRLANALQVLQAREASCAAAVCMCQASLGVEMLLQVLS